MNNNADDRAFVAQATHVRDMLSKIITDDHYSDSDYDYLSAALDVLSVVLDASFDDANAHRALVERWDATDLETIQDTLLPDVCPDAVKAYLLGVAFE